MKQVRAFSNTLSGLSKWVASRWFWRITIGLFVVQSSYVALVGRFSMAFDEYYHLGSIQAYAKVWLPWSVQQPPGPAIIGANTADGSYLYHYLMSFPYRVLAHITPSVTTQVVVMRLVDVVIVVVGLYIFRRLLLHIGMSKKSTHALLFIITLLPMTTFLSGQLTYDTLWFTMTAVSVLAMVKLAETVHQTHTLPLMGTVGTLSLLLVTSQIKYAFLPMALAGGIFFILLIMTEIRSGKLPVRQTLTQWKAAIKKPAAFGLLVLLCVSALFFGARYGSNIVKYHTPVPDCDAVLSTARCLDYGPFARDENHRQLNYSDNLTMAKKVGYPFGWFHQMIRESYFAVGPKEVGYPTGRPLPIPYWAGYVVAIVVVVMLIMRAKYVWRSGISEKLLISIVVAYVLFLFGNNYQAYLSTGVPVAIHGRYVLALLPLIGYLVYVALHGSIFIKKMRIYVRAFVLLFMLLTFYGGGIAPFVLRSSDSWHWPHAVPISKTVRAVFSPFIVR